MKFVATRNVLLKHLAALQGVIDRKATIPILQNILFIAQDGRVTLQATDLDVSQIVRFNASVDKEGRLCLPGKRVFEIVRSLPDADVAVQADGEKVTIRCERSRFAVTGLAAEHFAPIDDLAEADWHPFPADVFLAMQANTSFAITAEESRYALNGAKFEIKPNYGRMVATDGYRLAYVNWPTANNWEADVLIPAKALREAVKLCPGVDTLEIAVTPNTIAFRAGGSALYARLLSGQFPNYELVIPKETRLVTTADHSRLLSAINRAILTADDRSFAVRLTFKEDGLNIQSQSADVGEFAEDLSVDWPHPELVFGANATYLQDFLSLGSVSGPVQIDAKDGNSQVLFRPSLGNDLEMKYIVMPMRV